MNYVSRSASLFTRIPNNHSTDEKVLIHIIRHEKNFFMGQELDSIELNLDEGYEHLEDYIKPNFKVTDVLLKGFLKRDQRRKVLKMAWVKPSEEHGVEFRQKFEKNEFKSLSDAKRFAENVFRQHSGEYQADRATVRNVEGVVTIRRRVLVNERTTGAIATSSTDEQQVARFKQIFTSILRNNYRRLMDASDFTNAVLKDKLNEESEAQKAINEVHDDREPSKRETRIIEHTLIEVLKEVYHITEI